jgi:hypothetical protein
MEDNIMANTRKSRVPKEEQLKLINECRTSGMTDIDWCREHSIQDYFYFLFFSSSYSMHFPILEYAFFQPA